ncbi:MAG: hypothetical protein R2878_06800 [Thermoleophilia bacterium]
MRADTEEGNNQVEPHGASYTPQVAPSAIYPGGSSGTLLEGLQSSGAGLPTDYERWNNALTAEFFSGRYGEQPVYLDVDDGVLQRAGRAVGLPPERSAEALAKAVRRTLLITQPGRLFEIHVQRLKGWDHLGPPPCVAVLCLLSLAADHMVSDGEFRSTNYYGRLMQLLGLDPADGELRDHIARAFREQTHELWDALERWMRRRPAERGIPTAQPLGHLTHIGYPISQALIRSADRQALHELFEVRGLEPGQDVSLSDMAALLEPWLRSDLPSPTLRRIARNEGGRSRIAEVAVTELRAWNGGGGPAVAARARLLLQARPLSHPRPRLLLSLLLATPEAGLVPEGARAAGPERYEIAQAADKALHAAVAIELPNGTRVTRQHRPIVLLLYDDLTHSYHETSRLHLARRMMVLAPARMAGRLFTTLATAAHVKPRVRELQDLGVAAPGWVVIDDLLLVRPPDRSALEGVGITPPAGEISVQLSGGVALRSGSRWLASRPPRIAASSLREPDLKLTLRYLEDGVQEGPVIYEGQMAGGGAWVDLIDLNLEQGRYLLEATAQDAHQVRARSRFTLDTPESSIPPDEQLFYDLDAPLGAVSAQPHEPVHGVQGASIVREEDADPLLPRSTAEPDASADRPASRSASADDGRSACRHRFIKHATSLGPAEWRCTRCGATGTDERVRRRRLMPRKGGHRAGADAAVGVDVAEDFDGLLEAVSALGGGPWGTLLRVIDDITDGQVDPHRVADGLEELAHIDVQRCPDDLRPERWRVSPPAIATSGDLAFLCGWRSEGLVQRLGVEANRLKGRLHFTPQPGGPSRITIHGLGSEDLELLGMQAADGVPYPVVVFKDPAVRLAENLPGLGEIRAQLPTVPLAVSLYLERLDPDTGQWSRAGTEGRFGSLRRDTPAGRAYWHCIGADCRRVDAVLARWLGLDNGPQLASYEGVTRQLTIPWRVGVPLPSLLGRAAVLCSGLRPTRRKHGLVYDDVDPVVADHLIAAVGWRPEVPAHAGD